MATRQQIGDIVKDDNMSCLERCQAVQKITDSSVNSVYVNLPNILRDVRDELEELEEEIAIGAENICRIKEELGDVVFSLCKLANYFNLNICEALDSSTEEFVRRFTYMLDRVEEENLDKSTVSVEILVGFWREAKKLKNK